MELLVIILSKTELLNDVLSVLIEEGITKATMIDSEGMGKFLAYEVPIFAGLRQLVGGDSQSYSKTIMAVTNDKETVPKLHALLKKDLNLDFTQPGTGIIFTISISNVIQSSE